MRKAPLGRGRGMKSGWNQGWKTSNWNSVGDPTLTYNERVAMGTRNVGSYVPAKTLIKAVAARMPLNGSQRFGGTAVDMRTGERI